MEDRNRHQLSFGYITAQNIFVAWGTSRSVTKLFDDECTFQEQLSHRRNVTTLSTTGFIVCCLTEKNSNE